VSDWHRDNERHPRSLAEAFSDERAGWIEGPDWQPMRFSDGALALLAVAVVALIAAGVI
jgi:hypothetical protein